MLKCIEMLRHQLLGEARRSVLVTAFPTQNNEEGQRPLCMISSPTKFLQATSSVLTRPE